MLTYQDYETALNAGALRTFLPKAIQEHNTSDACRAAAAANEYDRQRNVTVNNYTKFIAEHSDNPLVNLSAANNRIPSNFFHQLNVQRCAYLLGNGVSFSDNADSTKDRLGPRFDRDFYRMAYFALIHGESFGFWNNDRLNVFPITEFVPFYDEHTGALRAGARFWQLAPNKPMTVVLYDESGVTEYATPTGDNLCDLVETKPRTPYITHGVTTRAGGFEPTAYENYSTLPIVHMYGSALKQSTLVGLRAKIDAYDLIQSGFANDLMDCAQIYWIIENCGGMSPEDLRTFLNRLTRDHIATADTKGMGVESSSLKPYVQEVPFESRVAWLKFIRSAIYEGFGALDVTQMGAGDRTATEIDAAYQPLDEAADDFETQCTDAIQQLLNLLGIDDEPVYKRNRISNQKEQTEMIMLAAEYLDSETLLNHLPWITPDEVPETLARRAAENAGRFDDKPTPGDDDDEPLGRVTVDPNGGFRYES